MAKQLNVNLAFSADTSKVKAQLQDLQNQLNKLTLSSKTELGITKDIEDASRAAAELSVHLKNATNQQTGTLDFSKLNQSIKQSGTSLQQYGRTLQSLGPQGQQAFMSLAQAVANSEVPIRRTNAMLKEMGTALANTARWQLSSSMLHGFMGAVQSAYGYAQGLNESLNNIRIVTGQNIDQMAKFAEEANKAARALSTTTTEYTNASLIYYQQGLNDQQVKERTDITIKMANVARQSAEAVSDQMTAVWNNFYDGSKSLEHYADVMTALGAATASSTDEIAEGLNKFAAVADTVGLSYEYAASALATVTATTRQSADVVGTAFKTLFARIQDLELGKTLDDGTTLGSYSQALAKVGVQIKDTSGEMKSMDTILEEMAAKWDTLGKAEQIALAQSVAGVRQYTQLIALMDNWDFMEKNLATSNTSSGALQKQADTYAESWEAARDRVRAAAEGVYKSLINDEFFIDVLNNIEKIISFVDHLIDNLGGLKGVLMAVGAIATKVFSAQLSQGLTNMVYNIRMMTKAGREAEQNARKKIIDDAIEGIPQSKEYSSEAEKAEKESMRSQLTLQQEMMANADRMNAIEQARNQMLLDRNKVLQEQAILAAKAEDVAIQQKGQAVDAVQTRVAANFGNDQQFQLEILRKITAETGKMKESFRSHSEIDALFTAFKQGGEASKESVKQLQNQIIELKSGNPAVQALINSMKDYDLTVDNVEENITTLKAQIKALVTDSAATLKADIIPEEQMQEGSIEIDNLVNSIEKWIQAEIRRKNAVEDGTKAHEAASQAIQDSTGNQKQWADIIVESANFAFSAASALQMLGGAFDQLRDPDVSGWQKFLTVLTTLGMVVPTLISLWTTFKKLLSQETIAKIANVAATLAQAAAEKKAAQAREEDSSSIKKNIAETWRDTKEKLSKKGQNIKNTWNDASYKKSGDRFEQIRQIKNKDGQLVNVMKDKTTGKFMTEGAAKNMVGKEALGHIGKMAGGVALIAAGVMVAVGAVKWGIAQFNKYSDAAKEAAQQAQEAATAYQAVSDSYNAFTSNLSAYQKAQSGLKDMTKGTLEYREAVLKANESAMQLLDTYENLEYTVDTDGLIVINEASLEQARQAQLEILENAQRSKQLADQNAKNKELKAKSVEFQREELNSSQGTWRQADNAIAATAAGTGSGALIGAGIGTLGGPIGAAIGAGIGAIAGAITGVVGSVVTGAAASEEEEAINRLAEVYSTAGNAQFATDEAFEKLLREDLKLDDEALIKSLVDNRESTLKLVKEVSANTEAINAQNAAVVQNYFKDQLSKSGLSEEQQAAIASRSGALLDEKTEELYESTYKDKFGGKTDAEVQKAYAEAMGWATNTIDNQSGNKAKYFNKDGTEVGVISDEVARRYLAEQEALKKLGDATTKLITKFKQLERSSDKYDKALLSYLENRNFSDLTEEEYNELYKLIAEKTGDETELSKDDVKQYIHDEFNNGQVMTDEDAQQYGYNTAEQFYNDFFDKFSLYEEHRASANNDIAAYAQDLVNKSSVTDIMSTKELSMMGKQINRALIESGEEAAHYVANAFYQKAASEADKVAVALDGIDWSTIDADGLSMALMKAGVSTEYTTNELNTLIDYMVKDVSRAVDVVAAQMKTLDNVSNLQQGDTISLDQYKLLGAELQSYFTLMADGTYKLTQNALDFYQAVTQVKSNALKKEVKLLKIEQDMAEKIIANTMDQYKILSTSGDKRNIYGTYSNYQEYLDKTIGFSGALVYGSGGVQDETGWKNVYAPGSASISERVLGTTTINGKDYTYDVDLDTSGMTSENDVVVANLTRPKRDDKGNFMVSEGNDNYLQYEYVQVMLKSKEKWEKDVAWRHEENKKEVKTTTEQNKIIADQLMLLAESSNETTKTAVKTWKKALENNTLTMRDAEDIYKLVETEGQKIYDRMLKQAKETQKKRRIYMDSLALQAKTAKERVQLLKDDYIDETAYNLAVSSAQETEKMEGLDVESIQNYAEHLRNAAIASDTLFDIMNQETLEDVAAYTMKMNRGVETLISNFEEWGDVLKNSDAGSQEFADSLVGVKGAMSDILGVQEEFISDNFILAQLEDIEKAANGDAEAIDRLAIAASKDILLNVGIQDENLLQDVLNLHNELTLQIPDIEVGATIDDQVFLAKAAEIVKSANMTADQATAYFRSMGFEPNFKTTTVQIPTKTPITAQISHETEPLETGYYNEEGKYIPIKKPGIITLTETIGYTQQDTEMKIPSMTFDGSDPSFTLTRTNAGSMNNSSSKNSGGKSGGGSKGKKAEKIKKSDTVKRYKEINDQLAKKTDALNDANKAMDRMYGASRLQQMQKQNAVIEDEIDLLKQKKDEALKYLKEDRQAVADAAKEAGVILTFDENGLISNYTEAMTEIHNDLESAINSANANGDVSDSEQEKIDLIQKRADNLQSAIDQYDKTRTAIDDLDNQSDDKFYKWQDNNAAMLSYKLELNLELNEMDLEDINYELSKIEDNFYSMAEAAALMSTDNGNSQLSLYSAQLGEYANSINALNAAYNETDPSQSQISQAAYVEGLKKARSGIMDNLQALQKLDKSMMEYYGNTLDMAAEEIAKYTDRMDHQTAVLDHYSSLLEIMGKSNDYKSMGKVLEGKAKTLEDQATVAKETMEMYKGQAADRLAEYQDALARGDKAAAELYLGQYEAALNAANEAEDAYLSKAKEWAEALKAVLENKLAEAGADLEKALTGGASFDTLTAQMERANSLQEDYLTTTNKIYKTNKMINTAQQAIDKTTNTVAKQKLKNFQKETAQLQNKSKLSQYELEIQQAKYDLLLAEIALEEAQQAKSTVRLQRDSEGSFGYVYTADANQVSDAEQKLADAQNNLYNIGLEGANNYTQKYQETMQEMYDTLTEIQEQYLNGEFATEEKYHVAMEEAKAYYYQKLQDYSSLYQVALTTDSRVVADAWSTDFADMTYKTDDWMIAVDGYVDTVSSAFDEWSSQMDIIATDTGADLDSLDENIKDIVDESKNLRDTLTGEDGVIAAINAEATAVAGVTSNYALLRTSMQETIKKYEELGKAAAESIKKQQKAITTANNNTTDYSDNAGDVGGDGNAGDDNNNDNEKVDAPLELGGENTPLDPYQYDTKSRKVIGRSFVFEPVVAKSVTTSKWKVFGDYLIEESYGNAARAIKISDYLAVMGLSSIDNFSKMTFNQPYFKPPAGFDTGGYTGSWGAEGKVAMLHEKELILNADDTTNFLASLEVLREIVNTINLHSMNAQLGGLLSSPNHINSNNTQTLEQQVTIEAHFPNASDRNEIEEAFGNLINLASQYANRK